MKIINLFDHIHACVRPLINSQGIFRIKKTFYNYNNKSIYTGTYSGQYLKNNCKYFHN